MSTPHTPGEQLDAALAELDARIDRLEAGTATPPPPAPAPCPPPTTPPAAVRSPADILGINGRGTSLGGWWNEGIGYRPSDPERGEHRDTTPDQLAAGWQHPVYFRPTADGLGVVFRVYCDGGRTSSGTNYPRSEVREFKPGGKERAEWDAGSGFHAMSGRTRVTHLASAKPEVCIAQIHDAEDDTFQLRVEGARWKATVRGAEVAAGDMLGDTITWKVEVSAGRIAVIVNGQQRHTGTLTGAGQYFKVGCYAQSSVRKGGARPDDWFETELYDLVVSHS